MGDFNSYPKVLIIGETFRYTGGGGITLINLFKDWPARNLAVVTEKIDETTIEGSCEKFYRLGHLEIKFPFPFNHINKSVVSGDVTVFVSNKVNISNSGQKRKIKSIIKYELEKAYYRILIFLGLCNSDYRIIISDQLLDWIEEFSPDIIYAQPFRYRDMVFAQDLKEKTGIPLALHIMDDSVSFSNKPNLLHFFWKKKINDTFSRLVENADIHLSISEAMSDEYFKRYNKNFIPFRNPIDVNEWSKYIKKDWTLQEEINIIYTGRLAVPNVNALFTFCKVVDKFKDHAHIVKLHIYSIDKNVKFNSKIRNLKSVIIHDSVDSDEIPSLISKFDIAFLPIDFTQKGIVYAKYSISTKTSEYMISGVPILLFAPKQVALTSYALKTKSMYAVSVNSMNRLAHAIEELINDEKLRTSFAIKAIAIAKAESDGVLVRNCFKELLHSY
jgi:hypothetical protein